MANRTRGERVAAETPTDSSTPQADPVRMAVVVPWATILKLLLAGALVWSWLLLRPLVLACLVAAILAVTLDPLVSWLERKGLPRGLAALALSLSLLAIIVGFGAAIWTSLGDQAQLVNRLLSPDAMQKAGVPWPLTEATRYARAALGSGGNAFAETALRTGLTVLGALGTVVIGFVLTVYLLIEGRQTYAWLVAFVRHEHQARVDATARDVRQIVLAYVSGNILTSLFATVFVLVALVWLHVPGALLLALLAGVCDFIPVLGFPLAAAPAILLAATVSTFTAGMVVGLYALYHTVENYWIAPKVYGEQLRLSNVGIILAFAAGFSLAGVVGALLALPIAASYPAVERRWLKGRLAPDTVDDHARLEAAPVSDGSKS